jgi:hypothetical protein
LYEFYGLDLQKTYYNLFISRDVVDIARGVSNDKFIFNSKTYFCESIEDWYSLDGWVNVLSVLSETPA